MLATLVPLREYCVTLSADSQVRQHWSVTRSVLLSACLTLVSLSPDNNG